MLKISKVEKGFYPYPGAQGMVVLHYHFDADDTNLIEKGEDNEAYGKAIVEEAGKLYDALIEMITSQHFEDAFEKSMKGQKYTILTFNDLDMLHKGSNYDVWSQLYTILSKLSYDMQYNDAGGLSSRMTAWPLGLVVEPYFYSGSEQFYEQFNLIICKAPLEGPGFDKLNYFALAEMLHNSNTHIFCEVKSVEDVDKFMKSYGPESGQPLPWTCVNMMITAEDKKPIADKVLEYDLRYAEKYTGPNFVEV